MKSLSITLSKLVTVTVSREGIWKGFGWDGGGNLHFTVCILCHMNFFNFMHVLVS